MLWVLEKEQSQWDGSFEYPQHMFQLRNKKINFLVRTLKCLSPDLFIYLFYKVAFDQGMHCLHKEYSIKI